MRGMNLIGCGMALYFMVGCSKGGDAAPAPLDLAKLGLKAEAPSGSSVGDGIMGDGLLIQGENLVVSVELATDSRPKTIKDAQEEASMYSPTNAKSENLTDGWTYLYENKGGMGANFFVNARREIAGRAYWCSTTSSSAEQQQNALKFCKSLKKG